MFVRISLPAGLHGCIVTLNCEMEVNMDSTWIVAQGECSTNKKGEERERDILIRIGRVAAKVKCSVCVSLRR